MKAIHTSLLDVLANYFSMALAEELANDILEFGYRGRDRLKSDTLDMVLDFYGKATAVQIAEEAAAAV
jgi:hypothetical protein